VGSRSKRGDNERYKVILYSEAVGVREETAKYTR